MKSEMKSRKSNQVIRRLIRNKISDICDIFFGLVVSCFEKNNEVIPFGKHVRNENKDRVPTVWSPTSISNIYKKKAGLSNTLCSQAKILPPPMCLVRDREKTEKNRRHSSVPIAVFQSMTILCTTRRNCSVCFFLFSLCLTKR